MVNKSFYHNIIVVRCYRITLQYLRCTDTHNNGQQHTTTHTNTQQHRQTQHSILVKTVNYWLRQSGKVPLSGEIFPFQGIHCFYFQKYFWPFNRVSGNYSGHYYPSPLPLPFHNPDPDPGPDKRVTYITNSNPDRRPRTTPETPPKSTLKISKNFDQHFLPFYIRFRACAPSRTCRPRNTWWCIRKTVRKGGHVKTAWRTQKHTYTHIRTYRQM